WRGESGVGMLKGEDVPSLAELRKLWEQVEAERTQFLAGLEDGDLTREIVVKPSGGGQQYIHRLLETLQHAVDHSSYHRGQIVTMLRQVNVKPPATGLIGFYRERSSKVA
ncbi:MAG TPA: DinB family protein, partial [Gemmatimonadaceae bacterium]|nr:DinB family protein [Gemmatimonadaceae bacterium]